MLSSKSKSGAATAAADSSGSQRANESQKQARMEEYIASAKENSKPSDGDVFDFTTPDEWERSMSFFINRLKISGAPTFQKMDADKAEQKKGTNGPFLASLQKQLDDVKSRKKVKPRTRQDQDLPKVVAHRSDSESKPAKKGSESSPPLSEALKAHRNVTTDCEDETSSEADEEPLGSSDHSSPEH